jgi:D-alanine-D-alanine ligase
MKILVLGGGISNEREVSIRSAAAVAEALRGSGYDVFEYDPANGLDELAVHAEQVDVVFPVLHGQGGEDGTVQRVLERVGVPFVGSSAAVSEVCFDKVGFKQVMRDAGIAVPNGEVVGREFLESKAATVPFVLKPYDGGSSIDTFIIRTPNSADQVDATAFDRHPKMLYEELIVGTETTIAILDGKALPVIENNST